MRGKHGMQFIELTERNLAGNGACLQATPALSMGPHRLVRTFCLYGCLTVLIAFVVSQRLLIEPSPTPLKAAITQNNSLKHPVRSEAQLTSRIPPLSLEARHQVLQVIFLHKAELYASIHNEDRMKDDWVIMDKVIYIPKVLKSTA